MSAPLSRTGLLVVAGLIAVALWNPPLPGLGGPVHLVLLLDDSESLGRDRVDAAWSSLRPLVAGLPDMSRLTLIRFAAGIAVELDGAAIGGSDLPDRPPRALPLSGLGSDIAAALRAAAEVDGRGLPVRMLLVSDGRATTTETADAVAALDRQGPRPLWWDIRRTPAADAWIDRLEVPARLAAGDRLPVRIMLGSNRESPVDGRLTIRLDGRPARQRRVRIGTGKPVAVDVDLDAPAAGLHRIEARLESGLAADAHPANDRASALVDVAGEPRVLVVSRQGPATAVGRALTTGGWAVQARAPAELRVADLTGAAALVLDDVPVAALTAARWQRIVEAVTGGGTGLLVLGGPASFGAGGYRRSTLETLLPVVSEPPERLPAAAVLFAIDSSGSMGQPGAGGTSRLALAREAVRRAVPLLGPRDQAGLLSFAADAAVIAPMQPRDEVRASLEAIDDLAAGGGTRLAPAIAAAVETLGRVPLEQRLLVLISDGQVAAADADSPAPDDPAALGRALAAAGIEPIALAVGEPERSAPLQALAAAAAGRFQAVTDGLGLPRLVETEVRRERTPSAQPVQPVPAAPLPFPMAFTTHWPPVAAYAVTRARESARIGLTAPNGDPLLAWHRAGLGRVAALTTGVGPWTPDWRGWSGLPPLLGGLLGWVAGHDDEDGPAVAARHEGSRIRLAVDAGDAESGWSDAQELHWRARGPAGTWRQGRVGPDAPGHFALGLKAMLPGRYDVLLELDGRTWRRTLWHEPRAELLPSAIADQARASLGTLPSWSPERGATALTAEATGVRGPLIVAAMAILLALMIRAWLTPVRVDPTRLP